jgi:glycosyltransferase involved in cell wall biosynthesis
MEIIEHKPIRILQVFGSLNRGGAETMLMNIYRNIDCTKLQFDFIIHTKEKCDYIDEIISLGGKIFSCPKYKGINQFEYKKWWRDFFIEHNEYKIIHSHIRSTASIILKIAKIYGLKTIAHSHNTSNGHGFNALIKKYLQKKIIKYADYCFACSINSGKWLYGKNIVDKDNFKVINNAIDIQKYIYNKEIRKKIRDEFNINSDFVIGHVGRFHTQKNHTFIIDIFNKTLKLIPNAKLMLIGEGELKNSIEKKVKKLNIQDKVIFTGIRKDVPYLMQAMDCFIFSSKYEGLPVTLIEAQASGLPIVMSDTISDEVVITGIINKVSLNDDIQTWVDYITKTIGLIRQNTQQQIINASYDIKQTSKWLEEFYLKQEN